MASKNRLTEFLDKNKVKYQVIEHSPAYTAQQTAQSAHIPGKRFAKSVIVKIDGKIAMVVLPANHSLDLTALKKELRAKEVELAHEYEFTDRFEGCDIGAEPIFANLWDIETYASKSLEDEDSLVFNACTHSELIEMKSKDFWELAHPTPLKKSC